MQKWEYRFIVTTGKKAESELNTLGKEGWEVASMTGNFAWVAFVLKRVRE